MGACASAGSGAEESGPGEVEEGRCWRTTELSALGSVVVGLRVEVVGVVEGLDFFFLVTFEEDELAPLSFSLPVEGAV